MRIYSLQLKLFWKHVKIFQYSSMRALRTFLYSLIIGLTPTRFHRVVEETNYVLLLRYRSLPPYIQDITYSNFEGVHISPLLYRRRGAQVYYKSPPKVALSDYWFRRNKSYV